MRVLSKLLCLAIVLIISGTGCITDPKTGVCKALFVNTTATRLTLVVDGKIIFSGNFLPGEVWIKDRLDDGTIHSYEAYAADPRVFYERREFKVVMGHTHTYDIYTVNTVIRLGGSISSSVAPDTSTAR